MTAPAAPALPVRRADRRRLVNARERIVRRRAWWAAQRDAAAARVDTLTAELARAEAALLTLDAAAPEGER